MTDSLMGLPSFLFTLLKKFAPQPGKINSLRVSDILRHNCCFYNSMQTSTLTYIVLTGRSGYIKFDLVQQGNVRHLPREERPALVPLQHQPGKLVSIQHVTR